MLFRYHAVAVTLRYFAYALLLMLLRRYAIDCLMPLR